MKEIEENKKIKIILIAIISILVILLGIEAFFILKDTKTIKNAKQGLDVNKTIQTSTNPENDVKEEQPTVTKIKTRREIKQYLGYTFWTSSDWYWRKEE